MQGSLDSDGVFDEDDPTSLTTRITCEAKRRKMERIKRDQSNRKTCMIYPEDSWKHNWDTLMTLVLLFSCFVTPWRLAFSTGEDQNWSTTFIVIDLLFLIDMLLTFVSATYDENSQLEEDRGQIACQYLQSWFLIDALAIFPFQVLLNAEASGLNGMVRVARIGRLYKLIRLTKLIRIA